MRAGKHQYNTGQISTHGPPLKQVAQFLSSKILLRETSLHENSYAFGWVRSQLPSSIGAIGLNPRLVSESIPLVGKGAPSCLNVYHQGSFPGALAAVNLLSETTNSIKTIKIEVRHEDHELYFAFQDVESEKYEMTHYQDDIFTWLRPRN